MKNGSEWPLYEGIPIKKENIRPTVKVSKQVLDKKHPTACNGKLGKRTKTEFQNSWLYIVPCTESCRNRTGIPNSTITERNLGRRVGAPA